MRVSIIELAVKKINFPAKTQTFPKCGLHNSPTALNKDNQRLLCSINWTFNVRVLELTSWAPQVAQARNMSIGEYWHSVRNVRNIRICMGKKPIVSVTYKNERISMKNSLPDIKGVLRLSCVIHGPIYGRFMGCTVNGLFSEKSYHLFACCINSLFALKIARCHRI